MCRRKTFGTAPLSVVLDREWPEVPRFAIWVGTSRDRKNFYERNFVGFGKRGLLERGLFREVHFLEILGEFTDSRVFFVNPQTVETKGESDHFPEILERDSSTEMTLFCNDPFSGPDFGADFSFPNTWSTPVLQKNAPRIWFEMTSFRWLPTNSGSCYENCFANLARKRLRF